MTEAFCPIDEEPKKNHGQRILSQTRCQNFCRAGTHYKSEFQVRWKRWIGPSSHDGFARWARRRQLSKPSCAVPAARASRQSLSSPKRKVVLPSAWRTAVSGFGARVSHSTIREK